MQGRGANAGGIVPGKRKSESVVYVEEVCKCSCGRVLCVQVSG